MAIVYHTLRPGTIAQPHPDRHKMAQTTKGGVLYAASAARASHLVVPPPGTAASGGGSGGDALFSLRLRGRGGVQPPGAAGVHPSRTGFRQSYDFAFSAFIWKNRSCPPHGTMCGGGFMTVWLGEARTRSFLLSTTNSQPPCKVTGRLAASIMQFRRMEERIAFLCFRGTEVSEDHSPRTAAKPASRSAMMSSMCSVPMDRRMVFW